MDSTTHTLELPGLREDILRDHLAALGLLDWLVVIFPTHRPRLAWAPSAGYPCIYTSQKLPTGWAKDLLDAIQVWRTITPNPLGHGKVEAIEASNIRKILLITNDPRLIRFYTGITSQLALRDKGRRSEIIIESASRSVLKGVDDLLANKRTPIEFGPDLLGTSPKYEVSNTSRWHPAEYQSAAYCAVDPQFNKHRDRLGLNILALFGTSFYPVIDNMHGRDTCGFRRAHHKLEFSWPIWDLPLNIDEIRSLLVHQACHCEPANRQDLHSLGVLRVWRSRRFKPDGNNDYFSNATLA